MVTTYVWLFCHRVERITNLLTCLLSSNFHSLRFTVVGEGIQLAFNDL